MCRVTPEIERALDAAPASDVIWVTRSRWLAERFRPQGAPRVEDVCLGPDPRILATDGDGGYLLWLTLEQPYR